MTKVQRHSIARKLTWMNLLVSGAALLLACSAFIGYDWVTFRQNTVRNLSVQAEMIGANCVTALVFNDPQSAANTLSAPKASRNILSAHIYTLEGKPFAAYWRGSVGVAGAMDAIPPGQNEIHRLENGKVELEQLIVFQGKPTGIVYMESDLKAIYQRLERYVAIAAMVLMISLLAALLVSAIFRRAIAQPIVELAEVARIVSRDKNYSVRAAPGEASDELSLLIRAFNEMLSQIQLRDEALQRAQDQLEKRVEDRTKQLAAANKELEAFSYSVSHDLRAPLRSIDGFSMAVLEDYGDRLDEAGKEYLHRVRGATQRMAVLIDDLLNLARITRAEMHSEELSLSAMAKSIADDLRKTEPGRHAEFLIRDDLTAQGDVRLLRVVMENLLGNSWKYTSRHENARIEFGCQRKGDTDTFFVRDDGAGFDPRHAARLFGAFQRLHGMTEFPGVGVGLATVQRIIHRHGGEIWAESEIEKGATFYFTLRSVSPN
jgi:signal transduction histidine kinase